MPLTAASCRTFWAAVGWVPWSDSTTDKGSDIYIRSFISCGMPSPPTPLPKGERGEDRCHKSFPIAIDGNLLCR